jgi:hypothetical protein
MAFARDLKNTVLRIAAEQGDMPIFYRHFEPLRRPGQVGGHWLHNVKKILIESGFVVHERDKRPAWDNCNSKTSYTHFHRSYLKQNVASPMQRKYAEQNLSDSFVFRNAIDELRDLYKHFPLESPFGNERVAKEIHTELSSLWGSHNALRISAVIRSGENFLLVIRAQSALECLGFKIARGLLPS